MYPKSQAKHVHAAGSLGQHPYKGTRTQCDDLHARSCSTAQKGPQTCLLTELVRNKTYRRNNCAKACRSLGSDIGHKKNGPQLSHDKIYTATHTHTHTNLYEHTSINEHKCIPTQNHTNTSLYELTIRAGSEQLACKIDVLTTFRSAKRFPL